MYILEIIGAILSILGAWYMSYATKEYLYKAFLAFFISNSSLLIFFLANGKIPMIIQFVFFFATAFLGMIRMSSNREKTIKLLTVMTIFVILSLIIALYSIEEITFEIKIIDIIASSIAISGAFLLSSTTYIKRNIAYIMFIIADILFVYIAFTNGFYFFLLQSAFFVFTGSRGLIKNISLNSN